LIKKIVITAVVLTIGCCVGDISVSIVNYMFVYRYQKTNAALQNFGDYASRKLGSIRYWHNFAQLLSL